jgi:nucleoside-diphosphate-sugar epimerase
MSRSGGVSRQLIMDMSNIVITGATGVVGRRAVRELVARGHRVVGVTRSAAGRGLVERLGARAVEADVFDQAALTAVFAGADAVVNLLTHIPSDMTAPGAWDENDRLRRDASAAVARAAQSAGVERHVQESLAFLYADGGDRRLDEDAPVLAGATTATALVAEANAAERFGGTGVVLRFGLFVGPDSVLTQANVDAARAGISPSLGRRGAYLPTLWLDDAATAVAAALRAPAGTYNVADEDPPTRAEVDAALAAVVGRDSLRPAIDAVPPIVEPVTRSQRLSSRRLGEATGWTPSVRGGTDGWSLIAKRPLAA